MRNFFNDTTSRVSATDQQGTVIALASDNRDEGDCGLLDKGIASSSSAKDERENHGAAASDNVSAGEDSSLEKGMLSCGSTSDQQAIRGNAADSEPFKNKLFTPTLAMCELMLELS